MKKIIISFFSFMMVLWMGFGITQIAEQKKVSAETSSVEEFNMIEGAQFRSYWSTPNCGIAFKANMPSEHTYVQNVKLFLAPYDYVTSIRGDRVGEIDYVNEFTTAGKAFLNVDPVKVSSGDLVYFRAGIKNIVVGNENRKFFGIFYYNDGVSNHYANMPNGEMGQARSIAYLSSGYYNDLSCTSSNDKYMTSYYMERSIKASVSKESGKNGNPVVDATTIKYSYNSEKNTSVLGGEINATFLDDYITDKTTSVQVGEKVIDVTNSLDFKLGYSPLSEYINQIDKTGEYVNILKAGSSTETIKMGLDDASYSVNIAKFDLINATLTSENITFIDTLVENGAVLTDSYKATDISPSILLNVPKVNNMLSDKEFNNSNVLNIATLLFTTSSNGGNGSLINADTDIKANVSAIISGDNFIGNSQATTTATKSKFNVALNTSADESVANEYKTQIPESASQNYYYGQTYSYNTVMYGHNAYEGGVKYGYDSFAGTVGANNETKNLVYKPKEINVTVNYDMENKTDEDLPDNVNEKVKFGYSVSYISPSFNGYEVNYDKVDYTIDSETEIYSTNVQYNLKTYSVTYNYIYYDAYGIINGSTAVTSKVYSYKYKSNYNYTLPEMVGFNTYTSQNRVNEVTSSSTRVMPLNGEEVDIYYTPSIQQLTVSYLNTAEENSTLSVKYGYPYKVSAPRITGFVPQTYTMSGTMDSLGKTISFTYDRTGYSADGKVYYENYVTTTADFAKTNEDLNTATNDMVNKIANGTAQANTGSYYGGYNKTVAKESEPKPYSKFYLYNNNATTPINGFVSAETLLFKFDFTVNKVGSGSAAKFGVIIESADNSETNRNFIYFRVSSSYQTAETHEMLCMNTDYSDYNGTPVNATVETELINCPSIDYLTTATSFSVYKKGSSITIKVGSYQYTYEDDSIAGNCFVGIFAINNQYTISNAVYRVDNVIANLAKVADNYHSNGTSGIRNYGVNQEATYVGGYNKWVTGAEYSDKFYLFREFSTSTSYLKAETLNLEFEYKLNSVVSASKTAKFGVVVENESYKNFIYFRVANGINKQDIYINSNYADKNGQLVDAYGEPASEDIGKVTTVGFVSDYADYVKISIFKKANTLILRINDIIVYQYQSDTLSGKCYYALFGTYSEYTIQNAQYSFDGTTIAETVGGNNDAYHSKTFSATNFYYQTDIVVEPTTPKDNPKVGIVVRGSENKNDLLFFYWNLHGGTEPTEKNRKVSLVTKLNGVYSWVTNRDEAGANWVGGEKSVYLAPGNSGTIIGGIHTFSVLKQGNVVTFMLNGVPCLQSTHTDFSGDCTVGLFAHGQSYTAYNGIFIQEEAKLNEIAQERGIVGDEVLLDGTISSSEWNLGKVIEQKASNGEYNKYSVVLGRAFIYVLGEMGTFNYRDDATVMDGTEEDSELESSITYKTWSNTNIEIRSYNEGESQTNYYRRAYLNAVLNSASVANFTFNKAIKTVGGQDLHVITYEIMIPYTTFGYSNPTNFTYLLVAVKPGVVSASSTQLYSNSELGGSWWTNGQKHYVTANGIV